MDTVEIGAHKVGLRLMEAVEVMQRVFLGSNSWIRGYIGVPDECFQQLLECGRGEKVCCLGTDDGVPDALL